MGYVLKLQKAERTKLRRLPFLPRFGFTLEGFGHQLSFKQVPILETLVNMRERGAFTLEAWRRLVAEAAEEIRFPGRHPGLAQVKDLPVKSSGAGRLKKAPAKAATVRKKDSENEAAPPA